MAEHDAYLERSGVAKELQQVLGELVARHPEDPLAYLAKHFEKLVTPETDSLVAAVELLHSSTSLHATAVYKTFALLSENDGAADKAVLTIGVHGYRYNKLLRELCCYPCPTNSTLDPHTGDQLLKCLQVAEDSTVLYETFNSGVTTFMTLREYLEVAGELFQLMDETHKGSIERKQGETILAQLSAAFSSVSDTSQSLQQARRLLQPSELSRLLQTEKSKGLLPGNPDRGRITLSLSEFKRIAAELFINHSLTRSHDMN